MDLTYYPYPSRRHVVMGRRGAVATSQPLAALAGMEMLLKGGNAVDAAIAMAATLTVVEPTSNGIGGDLFAMVWDGRLHGLNASGKSPARLTPDRLPGGRIPERGWLPVTVPGAVSGWRALHERFGRLPFPEVLSPAIRYAEEGFPVGPETARAWRRAEGIYLPLRGLEFRAFQEVFFPQGRAPRAGEVWRSPGHAKTLREIGESYGESLYRGKLAEAIAGFSEATGGLLSLEDLKAHEPEWVEALSVNYRGLTVHELPPNGQGIAALLALAILEGFDLKPEDPFSYHVQIEAMRLALADAFRYVADSRYLEKPPQALLSPEYVASRRSLIGERALPQALPEVRPGGTVYLAAADGELMVSLIQSNYQGFGSGILVPGTGIALQNRGLGFSLEEGHPNRLGPGKKPYHTIIPGFLTQEGKPVGPFGVMGGFMQPQGHVQVVVALADFGLNPQAALDRPRWQVVPGRGGDASRGEKPGDRVILEPGIPQATALVLKDLGHRVAYEVEPGLFGRGQVILRRGQAQGGHAEEVLVAASDPRAEGLGLAW
ncbi:gamma-glutamyltransferase [Thermus scotoductus]|uniref:Gamma-glutamyltransferase n=1 Tax=Thermus scotoductus TaxID=37636 RepID=A0A430SF39_THESC|nr:gamma-glutamyltransferase family protein [Thermus scotoductus]RTH37033.1 gamma-glutamyltransferase [Thermus scotoductus]